MSTPEERAAIWRSLFITMLHLTNTVERDLRRDADLTLLDIGCLFALSASDGEEVSMGRLAALFAVEPSVITYRLKRLERLGYAERRTDPVNRRVTRAVVTGDGRAHLRAARSALLRSAEIHFFDHVRPELLPPFHQVLVELADAQEQVRSSG